MCGGKGRRGAGVRRLERAERVGARPRSLLCSARTPPGGQTRATVPKFRAVDSITRSTRPRAWSSHARALLGDTGFWLARAQRPSGPLSIGGAAFRGQRLPCSPGAQSIGDATLRGYSQCLLDGCPGWRRGWAQVHWPRRARDGEARQPHQAPLLPRIPTLSLPPPRHARPARAHGRAGQAMDVRGLAAFRTKASGAPVLCDDRKE